MWYVFFFKQKTAYELRISDCSSDVCSSDLPIALPAMVKAIEFLAPDVAKVTLRLPLHENLKITAGQFIDLTLANGVRRSYSIANPPKLSNMVRSEERRVGKEGVRTCRSRWSPSP